MRIIIVLKSLKVSYIINLSYSIHESELLTSEAAMLTAYTLVSSKQK